MLRQVGGPTLINWIVRMGTVSDALLNPERQSVEVDAPPSVASARGRLGQVAAIVETCLIIGGMMILAGQPHQVSGDGSLRLEALTDLLDKHQLSTVPYSLIGPLFAAPFWYFGRRWDTESAGVSAYNTVLYLAAVVAIGLLLVDRIDRRLLRRFLLLLVAGTMIAANIRDFYGETFTATAVGVGLLAAVLPGTSRVTKTVGWIAVVLGVANTPASLVALGLVVAVLVFRRRRLRYLGIAVAAVALILGEAWLRYGDPLHKDYLNNGGLGTIMPYSKIPGFSYPFLFGVLAIVFSFGRGLLWFTPGLFLPVRRRLRELSGPSGVDLWSVWLLWTTFVVGLVLVYARWWSWHGGLSWGPRFFCLAVLPASLALAVRLDSASAGFWANLATLGALVLSVWVAADSLVFGDLWPGVCYQDTFRLEELCHFTPDFSSLWYPFVAPPALSGTQQLDLAFYSLVLLWLAVPLLGRTGRQALGVLRTNRRLFTRPYWHW